MAAMLKVMSAEHRQMTLSSAHRYYIGKREMPDIFDGAVWPFGFYGISAFLARSHHIDRAVWNWCRQEFGPPMQLHQPPQHARRRDRHTWAVHGEGTMLFRDHAQAIAVRLRWC